MAEEKLLVKRDGEFCYPIYFENDFSFLSQALTDEGLAGKSMCIVSDSTVAPLYADQVKAELLKVSDHVYQFTFPAGEAYKNLDTVQDLFQCLIENGLDRKSLVVALGGGVTGDLSGFGAAAYLRGIDFIQIPTTLLAQVDSSVGGKTGVDFRQFKNMVGAFHQPRLVYMNMATLQSLPEREFGCGMGEILKTGLICDKDFFDFVCANYKIIRTMDPEMLAVMIRKCCAIKAGVVERDPKEQGERALLNLGHTIGHAVEKLMNFSMVSVWESDWLPQLPFPGKEVSSQMVNTSRSAIALSFTVCLCMWKDFLPETFLQLPKRTKKWNRDRLNLFLWMVLERVLLTRQLRIRSFLWEFTPSAGNLSWKIKQLQTTMIFH